MNVKIEKMRGSVRLLLPERRLVVTVAQETDVFIDGEMGRARVTEEQAPVCTDDPVLFTWLLGTMLREEAEKSKRSGTAMERLDWEIEKRNALTQAERRAI